MIIANCSINSRCGSQLAARETVMITPLWRASGAHSKPNWSFTATSGPEATELGKQLNIWRFIYNRQEKQKKLGYLSPVAFERRYYEQQKAA